MDLTLYQILVSVVNVGRSKIYLALNFVVEGLYVAEFETKILARTVSILDELNVRL